MSCRGVRLVRRAPPSHYKSAQLCRIVRQLRQMTLQRNSCSFSEPQTGQHSAPGMGRGSSGMARDWDGARTLYSKSSARSIDGAECVSAPTEM